MKYIANVSGGAASVAMLLFLLEEQWPLDGVVHFCMGDNIEFKAVLKVSQQIDDLLRQHDVPYMVRYPNVDFLECMYGRQQSASGRNSWCGGCNSARYGMYDIKVPALKEMEDSFRSYPDEPIISYIGICSSERSRIKNIRKDRSKESDNRILRYPLIEMNWSKEYCVSYAHAKGFFWHQAGSDGKTHELYDMGFSSVSCMFCRNKSLHELRCYYRYFPEIWTTLQALQKANPKAPFRTDGTTVADLEKRFSAEEGDTLLGWFEKI